MFAERDILCRAFGEGQSESCLLVNGRCDCADIQVITEYAQSCACRSSPVIAIAPEANAGRGLFRDVHTDVRFSPVQASDQRKRA